MWGALGPDNLHFDFSHLLTNVGSYLPVVAGTYADSTVGIALFAVSLVLPVRYWTTYVWSVAPLGTCIESAVTRAGYFTVLLVGAALLVMVVLAAVIS